MPTKHEETLQKLMEENHVESTKRGIEADKYRARTVSVGHSGGGEVEIMMRGTSGDYLFNVYQPVEVIELINQLSAAIGCHIHIKPREDFSCYREWNEITDEQRAHLGEHAPFAEYNSNLVQCGKGIASIRRKTQALEHLTATEDNIVSSMTAQITQSVMEKLNVQKTVAAKKTVKRKSSKRSKTTAK